MKFRDLMRRMRAGMGFTWALCMPLVVVAIFFGLQQWSDLFAELPFMKIHPRHSGGEVVQGIFADGVRYELHRPVFDGLIADRDSGFMQIDVIPTGVRKSVDHSFDWNWDGISDFQIRIGSRDDAVPESESYSSQCGPIETFAKTENGWILRIRMTNFNLTHQ